VEDRGRAQRHIHGMIKLKGKKCLDLSAYSVTFHDIIKLKGNFFFGFVILLSLISWHNKIRRKKDFIGRIPFRCAGKLSRISWQNKTRRKKDFWNCSSGS
jgi:hypothetical protein